MFLVLYKFFKLSNDQSSLTVGVKLLPPPRGFRRICWTCQTAGGILFSYIPWKDSLTLFKRGGGWLPSGATRGCYPQGMLELSEILILVRSPPLCPNVNNVPRKREGFKKRIKKVSVSPCPAWVLSPPDSFTSDALGLPAHRLTQRDQWHWS